MKPMLDVFSQPYLYSMSLETLRSGLAYTAHYTDPELGHMQKMWLDPLYMVLFSATAWDGIGK